MALTCIQEPAHIDAAVLGVYLSGGSEAEAAVVLCSALGLYPLPPPADAAFILVAAEVKDQWRALAALEPALAEPRLLMEGGCPLVTGEEAWLRALVAAYYSFHPRFVRGLLGKVLKGKLRKDMDELTGACGLRLGDGCRQFDNIRRVFNAGDEVDFNGNVQRLVETVFCLPPQLAWSYVCILFLFKLHFSIADTRRRLAGAPFSVFSNIASAMLCTWTPASAYAPPTAMFAGLLPASTVPASTHALTATDLLARDASRAVVAGASSQAFAALPPSFTSAAASAAAPTTAPSTSSASSALAGVSVDPRRGAAGGGTPPVAPLSATAGGSSPHSGSMAGGAATAAGAGAPHTVAGAAAGGGGVAAHGNSAASSGGGVAAPAASPRLPDARSISIASDLELPQRVPPLLAQQSSNITAATAATLGTASASGSSHMAAAAAAAAAAGTGAGAFTGYSFALDAALTSALRELLATVSRRKSESPEMVDASRAVFATLFDACPPAQPATTAYLTRLAPASAPAVSAWTPADHEARVRLLAKLPAIIRALRDIASSLSSTAELRNFFEDVAVRVVDVLRDASVPQRMAALMLTAIGSCVPSLAPLASCARVTRNALALQWQRYMLVVEVAVLQLYDC